MRLKAYFHNPNNKADETTQTTIENYFNSATLSNNVNVLNKEDEHTHNKFKPKSSFDPKIHDPFLEAFFVLVKDEIDKHIPRTTRSHNLTKEEQEALLSLQNNPNIIIKRQTKVLLW